MLRFVIRNTTRQEAHRLWMAVSPQEEWELQGDGSGTPALVVDGPGRACRNPSSGSGGWMRTSPVLPLLRSTARQGRLSAVGCAAPPTSAPFVSQRGPRPRAMQEMSEAVPTAIAHDIAAGRRAAHHHHGLPCRLAEARRAEGRAPGPGRQAGRRGSASGAGWWRPVADGSRSRCSTTCTSPSAPRCHQHGQGRAQGLALGTRPPTTTACAPTSLLADCHARSWATMPLPSGAWRRSSPPRAEPPGRQLQDVRRAHAGARHRRRRASPQRLRLQPRPRASSWRRWRCTGG